ncbi:MAG: hypothetical protein ACI9WC_000024 [Arenicella sp.]|jgi:hypothetical protein
MQCKDFLRKPYWGFTLFFSIYLLNIFVGKVSLLVTDGSHYWSLNVVFEFLLLLMACVFFVSDILQAEAS